MVRRGTYRDVSQAACDGVHDVAQEQDVVSVRCFPWCCTQQKQAK